MLSTVGTKLILLISVFCFPTSAVAQDAYVTIPLNNTVTNEDTEMYGGFITLNGSSTFQYNFTNINKNLNFIVFQVHTHLYNITLYQDNKLSKTKVTGTNVGLVNFIQLTMYPLYIINSHENATIRAYISVHGYMDMDPIPGGCNMEFPVPISPYLRTKTEDDYIFVDAAPASIDPYCDIVNETFMSFHMMYLPEMNFYADTYFDGIRKMMTLKNIKENGHEIPMSSWPQTRRMLSAYPGSGAVFVVVAKRYTESKTMSSVYVPSFSYGCPNVGENGCEIMVDMFSEILFAVLLFVGMFICFFGHRFFKSEMFLAGFFSGFIISYVLIALITIIDMPALLAASTLSGIFFGAIWLLFWWLYGIPVIAVLLPSLNLGFLLAAIFYYKLPGTIMYLEVDFNFWSLFALVMLLTALALVSFTYAANIMCCAVLGAYASVFSIDYYLGANLRFIMINTIRRAIVPHFNMATLSPPVQWRDTLLTMMWIVVAILGFLFQHWYNLGRPPFPPPPRSVRPSMPAPVMYGSIIDNTRRQEGDANSSPILVRRMYSERTPLLA